MISLTLSTEFVRNTVITNEQGQVLYKTNTPFSLVVLTTTIQKIKPNEDQSDMRDQFDVMGEIEWHTFSSSKFRFRGDEVETSKFIPKRGLFGQKRSFTGPDGRPYVWDLRSTVVVLSRDDGSRTEVARAHRETLGIIGKRRKAKLEVSPEVAHMMDTIIMTFIYAETLRKEQQEPDTSDVALGIYGQSK